ncbi:hypothetical protein Tco_1046137 [Tanacetum coccineum]
MRALIKEEVNTQLPQILPQVVSDFANPVIEKNITESVEDAVLTRSRDDRYKDQTAGSDRGTKRRKSNKDANFNPGESSVQNEKKSISKDTLRERLPILKEKSSTASLLGVARGQPSHTIDDSGVQQDQEFATTIIEAVKLSLRISSSNDLEYLKGGDLSRWYSTSVTKTKATTYKIKWIEDLVRNLWSPVKVIYDQHSYWGPKRQHFYGFAANMTSSKDVYFRKRIIAVTRLSIIKKYDYGHLEEIEVHREDQKLYKFREGDFPRLRLQDIEDMLLLLVQHKLNNLTIDERYDLNVALRMFTRRIVIQRRVEYLKLGVESYQKKLNVTKPDTFRSNLRNRTTYTAYSDPKGVIYKDQMNRNRLTRANELHKFSDGTLDDVQSALNDIAKGIRMEYLPNRRWSDLDKRRARVMIQDIDKKLYEKRLMRNL